MVLCAGDRAAVAQELATLAKNGGIAALVSAGALEAVKAALADTKNANAREGGLLALAALCTNMGQPAEPYLMPLLGQVLTLLADKQAPVRAAAAQAQAALEGLMCPHGVAAVLPTLFEGMLAQKWQTNEGACRMLKAIAERCPGQVAVCMPEIVPQVTLALGNARQGVKEAAADAMKACMECVNNKDLEQFIPMLIDTMQTPTKVPDCVHKLAATTFVQAVEAPTLSIMVPLLVRGLRHDNTTAIKRKAAVIIENMAKLVDNPLDAVPFLPNLLPSLEKVANEVRQMPAAWDGWCQPTLVTATALVSAIDLLHGRRISSGELLVKDATSVCMPCNRELYTFRACMWRFLCPGLPGFCQRPWVFALLCLCHAGCRP